MRTFLSRQTFTHFFSSPSEKSATYMIKTSWTLKAIGASCNVWNCYFNVQCSIESNRCFVPKKCQRWLCNSPWLLYLGTYLHWDSCRAVFPPVVELVLCISLNCVFVFPCFGIKSNSCIELDTGPKQSNSQNGKSLKFSAELFQPFYFPHPVAVSLFPAFFGWESICSFKWFGSGCLDSCTVAPSKTVINVYPTLNTSIIAISLNPYWLLYYS